MNFSDSLSISFKNQYIGSGKLINGLYILNIKYPACDVNFVDTKDVEMTQRNKLNFSTKDVATYIGTDRISKLVKEGPLDFVRW